MARRPIGSWSGGAAGKSPRACSCSWVRGLRSRPRAGDPVWPQSLPAARPWRLDGGDKGLDWSDEIARKGPAHGRSCGECLESHDAGGGLFAGRSAPWIAPAVAAPSMAERTERMTWIVEHTPDRMVV